MNIEKLESLSTKELRNLAEVEEIEDASILDRESLIGELLEKDDFQEGESSVGSENIKMKYFSSFSNYKNSSEKLEDLPGTKELPEYYNETSIHLLYKNYDWAYVFWSLNKSDTDSIINNNEKMLLQVNLHTRDGKKDSYDIEVGNDDREWNIGLSYDIHSLSVSLVSDKEEGKSIRRRILCESKPILLLSSFYLNHKDDIPLYSNSINLSLSSLVDSSGEVLFNSKVDEILSFYVKEGKNE